MIQENWAPIDGYPLFEVSDQGRVRNRKTGHIKIPQFNQDNCANVLLVARGRQSRRSIAVMVAEAFMEEPPHDWNASPVHLDGDRTNCAVENLAWRPRWFAIRYHQQFHRGIAYGFKGGVQHIETGEIFEDVRDAAQKFGMLEEDIIVSAHSATPVFPTWHRFQLLPQ